MTSVLKLTAEPKIVPQSEIRYSLRTISAAERVTGKKVRSTATAATAK